MPQPTTPTHHFHPTILREYDIRGIIGETLDAPDYQALGQVFGTWLRQQAKVESPGVVIGRDGRLSSPAMAAALARGLQAAGCAVTDVGLCPTPQLYFSAFHLATHAGMMVTGSHNPPTHNGCKMLLGPAAGGAPIFGATIRQFGEIATNGNWATGQGAYQAVSTTDAYIARLQQGRSLKPLKVVWDCGNGAAGAIVPTLVQQLPGQHQVLFGEVDGKFPNHHPDPTVPANLRDLMRAVAASQADLGIAFDGDADRIGAIDGQGRIVAGDQLLALLARPVLAAHPGATIIADVKASQSLFDEVARLGGQPLMWKTGHSLVKTKMKETKSPLAGEMSGHIFFADDYYGFDDAIYAALRLLQMVGDSGQSLSQLRDQLPPACNTPELRFEVSEARKFAIIDELKAQLTAQGTEFSGVDGVRVQTPMGWWLLRASNTQNVLVARAEAKDTAALAQLEGLLHQTLQAAGVATDQTASH